MVIAKNIVLGLPHSTPLTPVPMNFSIPKVGLTAIIGKNGAGKSTLLNVLAGEPFLLSGTLSYYLDTLLPFPIPAKKLSQFLAYVPQDPIFPSELKIKDFMELAFLSQLGFFKRIESQQQTDITRILHSFELNTFKDRCLGEISTGERQRVFLARALLQKPRILLLDEPTNHLDPSARFLFWKLLSDRQKLNPTQIIVSTHDMYPVRELADWILGLERGQILYNDTAKRFWKENQFEKIFGIVCQMS